MKLIFIVFVLVLTSCASRTETRDRNTMVKNVVGFPTSTVANNIDSEYGGRQWKKPIQASLTVNVNYGLNCISQNFSANVLKKNHIVFSRKLNNELSTTIDADFDSGLHQVNLTNIAGKVVDSTKINLDKDHDRHKLSLTACK